MSFNEALGDFKISLGGKKYPLKGDFRSFTRIEQLAESSLMELFQRGAKGNLRLIDVTAIVFAGIQSADPGSKLEFEDVGQMIVDHGFGAVALHAFPLVLQYFSGAQKKTAVQEDASQKSPSESSGTVTSA